MISSFEDYNHRILRKIQENKLKSIDNYPQPYYFTEPDTLFGGIRFLSDHPLPSGVNDRNLGTGGNIGKNISKTFKKLAKDTGKTLMKDAPNMVSSVVNKSVVPALSNYGEKALTNYLMPAVRTVAEDAVPVALGMGRKRRGRKPKYESESDEEYDGGKFNLKKTLKKGLSMAEKYAPQLAEKAAMTIAENPEMLVALGRTKGGKFNLKKTLKKGLSMAEKYAPQLAEKAAMTIAENPEMLVALGRKKGGRLVKGSPEAKEWARKMREAKEAKRK